ncbi:MAG: hypothetical protein QW052_06145 [Candidatus Nitrosocaldaceae archaeon]
MSAKVKKIWYSFRSIGRDSVEDTIIEYKDKISIEWIEEKAEGVLEYKIRVKKPPEYTKEEYRYIYEIRADLDGDYENFILISTERLTGAEAYEIVTKELREMM